MSERGPADVLHEIGRRLARLVEAVAEDWPDRQGRDWAEQAARLRRELADWAATDARPGAEPGSEEMVRVTGVGPQPAGRTGMRLGGTEGDRAEDDRGVRIAELPPN